MEHSSLRKVYKSELYKGARLEVRFYGGDFHYSFIDRFGRPTEVPNDREVVQKYMKNFRLVDATKEFKAAGWIY